MNIHIGTKLNDFLEEEGLLAESELIAIKRLIALQIAKDMQIKSLSKSKMAKQMGTSRSSLERLLDPENTSITLHTLGKAARVIGKKLEVSVI